MRASGPEQSHCSDALMMNLLWDSFLIARFNCADTRPFIQGKTAILRTMLVARLNMSTATTTFPEIFSRPVYCLWISCKGGTHEEGHMHSLLSPDLHGFL